MPIAGNVVDMVAGGGVYSNSSLAKNSKPFQICGIARETAKYTHEAFHTSEPWDPRGYRCMPSSMITAPTASPIWPAWQPLLAANRTANFVQNASFTPWSSYPRPLLRRVDDQGWMLLNGPWQFDGTHNNATSPSFGHDLASTIIVPFPPGSNMSGVNVSSGGVLLYRLLVNGRSLPPKAPSRARILLRFSAVAGGELRLWVNQLRQTALPSVGYPAVQPSGGSGPSYDITAALEGPCSGRAGLSCPPKKHEIFLAVLGRPPLTGLAGTVWIEAVPAVSVLSVAVSARADGHVSVLVDALRAPERDSNDDAQGQEGDDGVTLFAAVRLLDGAALLANGTSRFGTPLTLRVPSLRPWPNAYNVSVVAVTDAGGRQEDAVESAFALQPSRAGNDDVGGGDAQALGARQASVNGLPVWRAGMFDGHGCFYGFHTTGLPRAPGGARVPTATCGD